MDYNKEVVKLFLAKKYYWQWYGGHHMENRTAYFVNNFYLPKNLALTYLYTEFSALVRAELMKRETALKKIKEKSNF